MNGLARILKIKPGEVQAVLRTQVETQFGGDVDKDYPNLASFLSTPVEETATERVKHIDAEGMKTPVL